MTKEETKKIPTQQIKLTSLHLNTGQIKDVPKNPRFIKDERYEALKRSITDDPEMLNLRELVAYDNGGELVVILGNMRYRAMKELGYKEAPTKVLPQDTPPKKLRAYIQKDNIAFGQNDWDAIANDWDVDELRDFGLECEFLSDLDSETTEEEGEAEEDNFDVDANVEEETTTRLGDCFRLGNHRLMCGDSTNAAHVDCLCDGNAAVDLLVTDPPYGVDYAAKNESLNATNRGTSVQKAINADNLKGEQLTAFLTAALRGGIGHLKAGGAFYIWHAHTCVHSFETAIRACGAAVRQYLVWVKNYIVIGRQDYQWKHEPCMYGWKDGAAHYFAPRRDLTTVIEQLAATDPDKATKEELRDIVKAVQNASEAIPCTVINEAKPQRSALHPTMKPVRLIARHLRNSSRAGETVLDLFGGSGTTLIAAEQLGRKCYMMEYDPHYVDTIIKRWEELTGEKAVKIGNMNDNDNEQTNG